MSPTVPPVFLLNNVMDTKLNDANVWSLVRGLRHWDLGNTFDPVLDRIRDMRNNLHSLSKVVTSSLKIV
jgi:hypothetical protein